MKTKILFLFLLGVGLLSSCSLSDSESSKTASGNGSMRIGVSLSSTTSRVVETADASKGLISTWESTDSLRVFNGYTKNGSQGSMQGFKFGAMGTGISTTFVYNGMEGYSFTPNSSLYAFNALPTAGNYTKTYNSTTDNFTLSLNGLASQDGTVGNLKNYDAVYGASSVGSDGTPSAMSMNHLMSVIRFDLTNAAFTGTLTSVNFAYSPTSGSSLLPSSGTFNMSNTGTVTSGTLTGASSWTVNNVAVSLGMSSVYLMTFPDTRSGTLTIIATTSSNSVFSRTITLSHFSLTSANMKAYTVSMLQGYYNIPNNNVMCNSYSGPSTSGCPTVSQIAMYLGAGCYYDNSSHWSDSSGNTGIGGIWLKKKQYIAGFDVGTAPQATSTGYLLGLPSDFGKYFFLPSRGYVDHSNDGDGNWTTTYCTGGAYWSRDDHYCLFFNSNTAQDAPAHCDGGYMSGTDAYTWSLQ